MITFKSEKNYLAEKNTIAGELKLSDLLKGSLDKTAGNAWINIGGWQSWNPCLELEKGKKQPSLKCHLIKQWNCYLPFPGTQYKTSKRRVLAQFFTWFRWEDFYLVLVSASNIKDVLPPVQFVIDRKKNSVKIELCDKGKFWQEDEVQAKIECFTAESYFECREKLTQIFGSSDKSNPAYSKRFDQIQFLGKRAEGWESWYNHYTLINEKIIMEDLEALPSKENFIFQIDDGWEKQLGTWELYEKRFPSGFKAITKKIEEKGFVPGLWIAPFIVDYRSKIAKEHPDWLLRKNGKLVPAGFNPLWGANFGKEQPSKPSSFFCLDLSNKKCVDYLSKLIDKIINEWGFRYLKLDFLYAGMLEGDRKEKGGAYEFFASALKLLTARKTTRDGKPVAYLGCGTPLEMSFKDLPLSRIGCDTYEHWENSTGVTLNWNGRNSAYLNLTDSIGRALWDKIIFANDPDVIFVREENCTLTKQNKLLIATVAALFGSQTMSSDDPAKERNSSEKEIAAEIDAIFEKYKDEEFSVKTIAKNIYEVESKSKKYKGTLNLEEGYADIR